MSFNKEERLEVLEGMIKTMQKNYNTEYHKQKSHIHYERNKEKILARMKIRNQNLTPEQKRKQHGYYKKWYESKGRAYQDKYYAEHKEERKAQMRKYRNRNSLATKDARIKICQSCGLEYKCSKKEHKQTMHSY